MASSISVRSQRRPVLVGQQDELAVADPRVPARVLEQHQGEQGVELGAVREVVGRHLAHHPDQPDRLGGESARITSAPVPGAYPAVNAR